MKKIIILMILFCFDGCVLVGFDRGLSYIKTPQYKFRYSDDLYKLTVISDNNELNITYNGNECGGYYLFGPIIPLIPLWENKDCSANITIGIYKAQKVYVKFNDKMYDPINIESGAYTFPIPIKSTSNGAILIVEKDKQKFEIPFRYQHTFNFSLWPGR